MLLQAIKVTCQIQNRPFLTLHFLAKIGILFYKITTFLDHFFVWKWHFWHFWPFLDLFWRFWRFGSIFLKTVSLVLSPIFSCFETRKNQFSILAILLFMVITKMILVLKKSIYVKKKSKRCVQNRCKPQAMSNFLLKNYSKRGWILMKSQIWTKTINFDCANQGFENSLFLFFSALKKSE